MRLRWTIIPVLFFVAIVAIYNVCHTAAGPIDTIVGMARRISMGALFAIGFWSASYVLQRWMSQPVQRAVAAMSPPPVAPVPVFNTAPVQIGPGQYRVVGVDRETHFQTSEVIFADSPSNAQLKVELKGVTVAAVEPAR